jgi:hypothetical protein
MHDITFVLFRVPKLFGLLFSVCKKLFVNVKACAGKVKLFIFELFHFDDLLRTFGIFGTRIRRKDVFKFCT